MGSIGRTDLWGGDYNQIIASLKERVIKLPEPTVVISGHGPKTSIAREIKANPFLA
jgi:glyoxylase-like metal-dependent hydrolase (beta-lactamase superfamily II)